MNKSVLKNDRKKVASKATPVLQKPRAALFTAIFAEGRQLLDSLRAWAANYFLPQRERQSRKVESISNEDKVAILKTQCDYVRSCYRVKILERQQSLNNVPKNLDTEIDELLDSYQRLKRAYEKLESNEG